MNDDWAAQILGQLDTQASAAVSDARPTGMSGVKRPASALQAFHWPQAQVSAPVLQAFSWPQAQDAASENSGWQDSINSGWQDDYKKPAWKSTNDSWKQEGNDSSWKDSSWKNNDNSWQSQPKSNDNSCQSKGNSWKQAAAEVEEDIDVVARSHGVAFLQPVAPTSDSLQNAVIAGRQVVEVVVKGEAPGYAAPPISAFAELHAVLPDYVTSSLAQEGITAPFPIQSHTLPFTLRGFDVIGIAKTGSGKTLAFLLPAIAHCEMQEPMPYGQCSPLAVVLAPVRELASQIAEEAKKILGQSRSAKHPKGIGCVALYGGGGKVRSEQLYELKRGFGHIVVGTPGRMVDFLQAGEMVLNRVVFFVLDEADRMLDGGFEDQMNEIAEKVRPDRQTLFFSATWPAAVRKLASAMCRAPPMRVSIGQAGDDTGSGPTARKDIQQEVLVFDGGPRRPWSDERIAEIVAEKTERMNLHLRTCLANPINKVLVFVNTKQMCWELAAQLQKEGFAAEGMYGGLSQSVREHTISSFKSGATKLVVTTDVMARGLDIPNITHVLVYDCYGGIDDHVHRIGRTARGERGEVGHALIFYEFDPKYSQMPAEIITMLEGADQPVPPLLRQIASDVASGVRKAVHGTQRKKSQKKW